MNYAVEFINNPAKNENLEMKCIFEKDVPSKMLKDKILFDNNVESKVMFNGNDCQLKKIHLAPSLHKIKPIHSHELIYHFTNNNDNNVFMVSRMNVDKNNDLEKIYNNISLKELFENFKSNYYYNTKNDDLVVLTKNVNGYGNTISNTVNKKRVYTDIFDRNNFTNIKEVFTVNDSKKPFLVHFPGKNIKISKDDNVEGFTTGKVDKSGTYMECEMLKDDGTGAYDDTAIVPLKTSVYEKGLSMFSHLLHYAFITVVAGYVFPMLVVTIIEPEDYINNKILRYVVGYISILLFFTVGLFIMLYGLLSPNFKPDESKTEKENEKGLETSQMYAMIGFYFMLIHCSFALGMYGMKMLKVNEMFTEFFDADSEELKYSFFNILSGLKTNEE